MEGMNIFKWHTFLPNLGDTFPQFGWFIFHRQTLAAANQRRSQRKLEPPGRHSQSGYVPNFRAFQARWWSLSVDSMMVFQASSSPFIWQFGRFSMVFPFFTLKGPWFLFQRFWDTKTGSAGDPKMVACQDQVSQMQGRAPASVTEVLGPTRQATRFFHAMLWEWYGNTKGAFGRRKVSGTTPQSISL